MFETNWMKLFESFKSSVISILVSQHCCDKHIVDSLKYNSHNAFSHAELIQDVIGVYVNTTNCWLTVSIHTQKPSYSQSNLHVSKTFADNNRLVHATENIRRISEAGKHSSILLEKKTNNKEHGWSEHCDLFSCPSKVSYCKQIVSAFASSKILARAGGLVNPVKFFSI